MQVQFSYAGHGEAQVASGMGGLAGGLAGGPGGPRGQVPCPTYLFFLIRHIGMGEHIEDLELRFKEYSKRRIS